MLAANRANAKKCTGPFTAEGKADRLTEKLLRAGDREGEALYRWFRAEITEALGGAGRRRSGVRSDSGGGLVLGARLEVLTSKTGMSLSFMGIAFASARPIKDSDSGLAVADRPDVLGATPSLLDAAALGAGKDGKGAAGNRAARELAGTVLAPAALPHAGA